MPTTAFAVTVTPPVANGFYRPTEVRVEDVLNASGFVQQNPGYLTLNGDTPFQERTRITDVTTLYFVSNTPVRIRAWVDGDDVSTTQITPGAVASPAQLVLQPQSSGVIAPELSSRFTSSAEVQRLAQGVSPNRIVTLVSGQANESPTGNLATISADTVNFKLGTQGHKMTVSTVTSSAEIRFDPLVAGDPLVLSTPQQGYGMWVYLADASKVSEISLRVSATADLATTWVRGAVQQGYTLVNGWNLIRIASHVAIANFSRTIFRVAVRVTTTDTNAEITIGQIWAELPRAPRLVFVADWATKNFRDTGYQDLKARGIPVVWATRPTRIATDLTGNTAALSEAELATLSQENGNSIACHSWDGAATESKSNTEIIADTLQCIQWLQARGYHRGAMVRPCWTQNLATNAAAARPFLHAYATPSNNAALLMYPWVNRWNISRWACHDRSTADMDTMFANWQTTYQTLVVYTHGVHDTEDFFATTAEWSYFLNKLDSMIAAVGLEAMTFEDLLAEDGVKLMQGHGAPHVVAPSDSGGTPTAVLYP